MRINDTNQNFKGLTALAKPLNTFYDANAALPTLLIETGVTLGRANEANKRGGKIEATERLVEQGVSAVVWLWGVQFFKKIGEEIGKKLLKVDNFNFDVGRDVLRNPIKNNKIDPKLAAFKAGNILGATAIATIFIGFILPKINHLITNKALKKEEQEKSLIKPQSIEDFKKGLKKDNISFGSNKLVTLAHTLENNSTARLLITDSGVISGRCYNARNKYERIENIFRDTASVYFYLFAPNHFVKLMNKMTKNADINPKALEKTVDFLKGKIKDGSISPDELMKSALGTISDEAKTKLDELFKGREVVDVAAFTNEFPLSTDKAGLMAKLQPIFEGNGVLTKKQAQDVLSNGWLTDPDFLKETMAKATKGASDDPMRFVSKKKLEGIRDSLDGFITQLSERAKAKGVEIDADFITKTANKNVRKNLIYQLGGLGLAAAALGILIPRVQYAITKHLTHKNEFPGTKKYDE